MTNKTSFMLVPPHSLASPRSPALPQPFSFPQPHHPRKSLQGVLAAALFVLGLFASSGGFAQQKPEYLPEHGFWQLVNERDQRGVTIVQFYTDDSRLIYQEKVRGVKFNVRKARTLRWLKEGLGKAMTAWERRQKTILDQTWMAVIIKN